MKNTWIKAHRGLLVLVATAIVVPVLWAVTSTPDTPVYAKNHLVAFPATIPGGYCTTFRVFSTRVLSATNATIKASLTTKEVEEEFLDVASLSLELQKEDSDQPDAIYWAQTTQTYTRLANDREGIYATQIAFRNHLNFSPAANRFEKTLLRALVPVISAKTSLQCEGTDMYGASSSSPTVVTTAGYITPTLVDLFAKAVLLDASARGGQATNPVTNAAIQQILSNAAPSKLFKLLDPLGTWASSPGTIKLIANGRTACYTLPVTTSANFLISESQSSPAAWTGMTTPCPLDPIKVQQIRVLSTFARLQASQATSVVYEKNASQKISKKLEDVISPQFSVAGVIRVLVLKFRPNYPAMSTYEYAPHSSPSLQQSGWLVKTTDDKTAPVCVLVTALAAPQLTTCDTDLSIGTPSPFREVVESTSNLNSLAQKIASDSDTVISITAYGHSFASARRRAYEVADSLIALRTTINPIYKVHWHLASTPGDARKVFINAY